MQSGFVLTCIFSLLSLVSIAPAHAGDAGFRWRNGSCVNDQGQPGFNPGFIGQCGDLRNVILGRISFDGYDFRGARFTNADLQQSSFKSADLTGTDFESANLAGVDLSRSKIIGANLTRAILRNTRFAEAQIESTRFSGADMRGTLLTYMEFKDCEFVEANLTGAQLDRTNFEGSSLASAKLTGASLRGANLKSTRLSSSNLDGANLRGADLSGADLQVASLIGATLTQARAQGIDARNASFRSAALAEADFSGANFQNVAFNRSSGSSAIFTRASFGGADLRGVDLQSANFDGANLFEAKFSRSSKFPFNADEAKRRGMVQSSGSVLIIRDRASNQQALEVKRVLEAEGAEVVISPQFDPQFNDAAALGQVEMVIHFNGTSYNQNMPAAGQQAIAQFVTSGGRFMYAAWNSWEKKQGRYEMWSDLILTTNRTTTTSNVAARVVEAQKTHPLLIGLPMSFSVAGAGYDQGPLTSFQTNPAVPLVVDAGGEPVLAARNVGAGTVVALNLECGERACARDPNLLMVFKNALNW